MITQHRVDNESESVKLINQLFKKGFSFADKTPREPLQYTDAL